MEIIHEIEMKHINAYGFKISNMSSMSCLLRRKSVMIRSTMIIIYFLIFSMQSATMISRLITTMQNSLFQTCTISWKIRY